MNTLMPPKNGTIEIQWSQRPKLRLPRPNRGRSRQAVQNDHGFPLRDQTIIYSSNMMVSSPNHQHNISTAFNYEPRTTQNKYNVSVPDLSTMCWAAKKALRTFQHTRRNHCKILSDAFIISR